MEALLSGWALRFSGVFDLLCSHLGVGRGPTVWAGNLSKLGDGACVLLMTPHTLHCTSTYCSLLCTHLSFLPLGVPLVPSAPPVQLPPSTPLKAQCMECIHTHGAHGTGAAGEGIGSRCQFE